MTVIIGISCSDGVVIGSDSAMAAGRSGSYTIEWSDSGALKIEIIEPNTITAVTGAFGLGQRFNDQLKRTLLFLNSPLTAPKQEGTLEIKTLLQQILFGRVRIGAVPWHALTPVEIGRIVAQLTIADFQTTASTLQTGTPQGWGLGALFAFVHKDTPYLIDFDTARFHPELKGDPDPDRDDQDRVWRCVSMGAGQQLADAFLAHAYQLLFGNQTPTVDQARLVVAWTIEHVKRFNTGLVGGRTRLAVLKKNGKQWIAQHEDLDKTSEILEQVNALNAYISDYPRIAFAENVPEAGPNPLEELDNNPKA